MFNTKYKEQIDKFHDGLFGAGRISPRHMPNDMYARYTLPPGIRVSKCFEADNGEWLPADEELSDLVSVLYRVIEKKSKSQ